MEVQRILHQRALDVKLDPELQRRCMTDLGKWCSEKTDTEQVRQRQKPAAASQRCGSDSLHGLCRSWSACRTTWRTWFPPAGRSWVT